MIKNVLASVAIALVPLYVLAVEEPNADPAQLVNLRASWQQALNNATAPLNLKYREALLKMRKDSTRAGNLEDVLAVDSEIKALEVAHSVFSPLIGFAVEKPNAEASQLVKLRTSWQLSLSNATAPLNSKYREALLKIKKEFTQASNLEDALAVDAEIKAFDARNATNPLVENPEEDFTIEGKWKVDQNGVIMIRSFNGENLIDHIGMSRPWAREKNKINIRWGETNWEKLEIDPKSPDVMEGINDLGQKITYTRIK